VENKSKRRVHVTPPRRISRPPHTANPGGGDCTHIILIQFHTIFYGTWQASRATIRTADTELSSSHTDPQCNFQPPTKNRHLMIALDVLCVTWKTKLRLNSFGNKLKIERERRHRCGKVVDYLERANKNKPQVLIEIISKLGVAIGFSINSLSLDRFASGKHNLCAFFLFCFCWGSRDSHPSFRFWPTGYSRNSPKKFRCGVVGCFYFWGFCCFQRDWTHHDKWLSVMIISSFWLFPFSVRSQTTPDSYCCQSKFSLPGMEIETLSRE
jgi:hypothetical protein